MNIRTVLLTCLLILAGANYFILRENTTLKQDIAAKQDLCKQWLSKLAAQQGHSPPEMPTQGTPKNVQTELHAESPTVDTPALPAETDIESLVSHSHRVQAVNHKYEFIILTAQIDNDEKDRLKKLLLLRERLSQKLVVAELQEQQDLSEIEDKLYNIEDEIELVLNDPLDYYRYELIKQRPL